MSSPYIVWFEDCDASSTRSVGGKCASLGELLRHGFDVPQGFAVTTVANELFLTAGDLRRREEELLAGIDYDRMATLAEASAALRALVEEAPIPDEIVQAVRDAYAELAARTDVEVVPVAVRSSATAEDLATASFAGQLQTYLWVSGKESVLAHLRRCWSGFFTPEALSYRHRLQIPPEDALMSVAVQWMVDPRAAGVMFTLNPVNGDRSKIMIESSWGLGEAVVSGEVNPDRFLVDKVTVDILDRAIASKDLEYLLAAESGRVTARPVDEERRTKPSLSDAEVIALATLGKQIEKLYGRPMDVEWAVDTAGGLFLLQARSETVWSQRARPPVVEKKRSALEYVLADLLDRVEGP